MKKKACGLVGVVLLIPTMIFGQDAGHEPANTPYTINVASDEVTITFHASDRFGHAVEDLNASDLDLFDDGEGPKPVVALRKLSDRPLRAALVLDTSPSMSTQVANNRQLAIAAAERLMRRRTDTALVTGFGRSRRVVQTWSHDVNTVTAGIRRVGAATGGPLDGTSLFDTLFNTCLYDFPHSGSDDNSARIIVLFSDGVDTSGQTTIEQAIRQCQRAHTAIYAVAQPPVPTEMSSGPETLERLAHETGGDVMPVQISAEGLNLTLDPLISDLMNEYQLFYRPKNFTHNGAFHRIVLVGPTRVAEVIGQSGYYAPTR